MERENGGKVKERKMLISMKENIRMIRNVGLEYLLVLLEMYTKESILKT